MQNPEIPVKELLELFLSVADVCDSGDYGTPDHLDRAYNAVFLTAWGQEVYSEAVDVANERLK